MKKMAIGTNRAGEDVEIMNEPMKSTGHYGDQMNDSDGGPILPRRLKKKKMKKEAAVSEGGSDPSSGGSSLGNNEGSAEGGDGPMINMPFHNRKKNVKQHPSPEPSVGFTDKFLEAVGLKRNNLQKEASKWKAVSRMAMRNSDVALPFFGEAVDEKAEERRRKKYMKKMNKKIGRG
jgi:hypothetical protein